MELPAPSPSVSTPTAAIRGDPRAGCAFLQRQQPAQLPLFRGGGCGGVPDGGSPGMERRMERMRRRQAGQESIRPKPVPFPSAPHSSCFTSPPFLQACVRGTGTTHPGTRGAPPPQPPWGLLPNAIAANHHTAPQSSAGPSTLRGGLNPSACPPNSNPLAPAALSSLHLNSFQFH